MDPTRRDPATLPGRPCSIAVAMDILGDRWALLAVREVLFGNHRFSDIARNTGAPRDRLAARLRDLVEAGVLERRRYQENPPRDGYHPTPAGRDLAPIITGLLTWGDKWAVTDPPMRIRHHDHPLEPVLVCAACDEPVRASETSREALAPGWTVAGPVSQP